MWIADDQVLISTCGNFGPPEKPCRGESRLSVDDFDDPSEEEIHVTVLNTGEPEYCFRLSTTSARQLTRELEEAIRKREAGRS